MAGREVYERALAELRRCEERVEQLRTFIALYEELSQPATAAHVGAATNGTPNRADAKPPSQTSAKENVDIVEEAIAAVREAGKPMQRTELYETLTAQGIVIPGENPLNVLTTRLYRAQDRIRNFRGIGYWPAGEPLPEGVVEAAQTTSEPGPDEAEPGEVRGLPFRANAFAAESSDHVETEEAA